MTEQRQGRPEYRRELKFELAEADMALLVSRLGGMMRLDNYALLGGGQYMIRSLYFDDRWDTAFEEKLMGVASRHKFRIRLYNLNAREVHLEKKIKQGQETAKESAKLTREAVERVLAGDYSFLLHSGNPLCVEFYHRLTSEMLRPRVIVDYERIPFVHIAGNTRITFDRNVRAGEFGLNLFDPELPTFGVLPPGRLIMEVKYTGLMPEYIRQAVDLRRAAEISASKYALACGRTMLFARRPGTNGGAL